jgi:coenzyme PQQ precursor peptide PqqA
MMVYNRYRINRSGGSTGVSRMSWRKPKVTRIAVGCEINAYACAVV